MSFFDVLFAVTATGMHLYFLGEYVKLDPGSTKTLAFFTLMLITTLFIASWRIWVLFR